ncbi:MAG TPA: IPT/TIG domain-containing protein [Candidatus Acidoferrum sp.]|nr:IPT/TIG domain-containing protein [Candidatus Acidoferrum sp.]
MTAAGVAVIVLSFVGEAQQVPAAASARILLVPRRMISGERATLAVLDVNGRLTPDVTIQFSNGDKVKTDATGRALFVAPLNQGVLFASIVGRPGRVATAILAAGSVVSTTRIESVPHFASLVDRFEITGNGFCGDADKNTVTVGGRPAFVLASSPNAMTILPPPDSTAGETEVAVSCGKQEPANFKLTLVSLRLEADTSPLQPGQERTLRVSVNGTQEKIQLEARNLAVDVAELGGGNPTREFTSGGTENGAEFKVTGKKRGNFLISIKLLPVMTRPAN